MRYSKIKSKVRYFLVRIYIPIITFRFSIVERYATSYFVDSDGFKRYWSWDKKDGLFVSCAMLDYDPV